VKRARKAERDKGTWAADLAAGFVTVLALVSSIVTLIAAPPRVGVIVGLATLVAGLFAALTTRWGRSRRIQRSLGLALAIVGLAVTGVGFYSLHEQRVIRQSAILTDTCASARDVQDAMNATAVAQFVSSYTAPAVAQNEKRLSDAVVALEAAANRSGSAQAVRLASRLEISVTKSESAGIFTVGDLQAITEMTAAMGSFHALCAHSSLPISNSIPLPPTNSSDFCQATSQLMGSGLMASTHKKVVAFVQAFQHYIQVINMLAPQNLQDVGIAIIANFMLFENAGRYSPFMVRMMITAINMVEPSCKAVHVGLGPPVRVIHFQVSNPKDSPGVVAVKLVRSMSDCRRPPKGHLFVDGRAGFYKFSVHLHCIDWPRQLQVFSAKINCSSWFSTHTSPPWRYVCGPSWVVRVSNVTDEITVAGETGGIPQPLSITKQSTGPA
jgi:hypothetical protein